MSNEERVSKWLFVKETDKGKSFAGTLIFAQLEGPKLPLPLSWAASSSLSSWSIWAPLLGLFPWETA